MDEPLPSLFLEDHLPIEWRIGPLEFAVGGSWHKTRFGWIPDGLHLWWGSRGVHLSWWNSPYTGRVQFDRCPEWRNG